MVRCWSPWVNSALLLLSLTLRAGAIIDVTLQMQLGNPSNALVDTNNHDHYLIQRTVEALDFSDNLGEPVWASWDLTAADVGSASRSTVYFTDTNLPPNFYRVTTADYNGVGAINFNRGHLCPSEDRTDNNTDNDLLFFMSNIMPQAAVNNQGVWGNFEGYCRDLTASNELLIVCGPSGFGTNRIPSGKAVIADYVWKIAVVVPTNSGTALSRITAATRVIALKIPNNNFVSNAWQNYVTSASQIETDTGFTFFTALPPAIASVLRNKVDGQTNPPPIIFAFTPTNAPVGASVTITGTNFASVQAVTFNVANAAFTVNSATQITAVVPTNATSGTLAVTTPAGKAVSADNFTVTGPPVVDLQITATHAGNFVQGDTGDTYSLVVKNIGTLASAGTVSVVCTLPASLTATAISGSGWTVNFGTLTSTRSDSLAPGASYPLITLTVNVATNAPSSVTNTVVVSGGGDANPDTASDLTTVNPSGTGGGYSGIMVGWDVSGQTAFGPSPLSPGTNAPNLSVTGLTRGAGVSTSGTGAARGWGGGAFTNVNVATAVAANQFVTFGAAANTGYKVSFASVSRFDYRRSGTGPANGVLQFQIGAGAFTDITNLSYSSTASTGASIGAIDLSGFAALQNVGPGTNVIFRIVNYGGSSSAGTWYIFDTASSTAVDLALQGTVTPLVIATNPPALPPVFTLLALTNNQFRFTITGTTGSNYVVQASTSLTASNWISIATNAAPFVFVESNASVFNQRFYRALVKP